MTALQIKTLMVRFGLTWSRAAMIAALHWGGGQ